MDNMPLLAVTPTSVNELVTDLTITSNGNFYCMYLLSLLQYYIVHITIWSPDTVVQKQLYGLVYGQECLQARAGSRSQALK